MISNIILKRLIWRFQIYHLFREIFKLRENKSNNEFREIRKYFRKTTKFEYFSKQIIYLEYLEEFVFQNGLNFDYFAKIAYKIAKSKYFSDI